MRQRRAHRRRGCAGSSVPIWNLPASESALQSSRRSRRSPGIQPVHREQRSCRRRCRRSALASVVHANAVSTRRDRAFALGQYAELQTRLGAVHTLFLAVFIKVFLAVSGHGLENARDAQRQHAHGFHAARGERLPPAPAAGYLPAHRRYPPPALPRSSPCRLDSLSCCPTCRPIP